MTRMRNRITSWMMRHLNLKQCYLTKLENARQKDFLHLPSKKTFLLTQFCLHHPSNISISFQLRLPPLRRTIHRSVSPSVCPSFRPSNFTHMHATWVAMYPVLLFYSMQSFHPSIKVQCDFFHCPNCLFMILTVISSCYYINVLLLVLTKVILLLKLRYYSSSILLILQLP